MQTIDPSGEEYTMALEIIRHESPTIRHIYDYIKTLYPGWIIAEIDDYSSDYPHLIKNWNTNLSEINQRKALIIIVSELKNDNSHTITNIVADALTKSGFVVRSIEDLRPCTNCNLVAVPTKKAYDQMSLNKAWELPNTWTALCKKCVDTKCVSN